LLLFPAKIFSWVEAVTCPYETKDARCPPKIITNFKGTNSKNCASDDDKITVNSFSSYESKIEANEDYSCRKHGDSIHMAPCG